MAMQLDKVVPFGRSLDEYRLMFALSEADLAGKILGVGDGPASFNAEMHALGKRVVSIDPVFRCSADNIERQFYAVVDNIIAQVKSTPDNWIWTYHRSPEHLRQHRIDVLARFLADYEAGKSAGRYVVGELPQLDVQDNHFDVALCSHFLFLYSDQFSYEFHRESILDMLRVAREVRIFPLLTLMLKPSPYVEPLMHELQSWGYRAQIHTVSYELQRGGNQMLSITRAVNGAQPAVPDRHADDLKREIAREEGVIHDSCRQSTDQL